MTIFGQILLPPSEKTVSFPAGQIELSVYFSFILALIIFAIGSSKYRLKKLIPAKVELDEWSANKILYFFFSKDNSAALQNVFFCVVLS